MFISLIRLFIKDSQSNQQTFYFKDELQDKQVLFKYKRRDFLAHGGWAGDTLFVYFFVFRLLLRLPLSGFFVGPLMDKGGGDVFALFDMAVFDLFLVILSIFVML